MTHQEASIIANRARKRKLNETFWDRFWSKVDFIDPNGCWKWIGNIGTSGYGELTIKSRKALAHRVVFSALKGRIPNGYYICHSCDNKRCVNPQHLFRGTPWDNIHDCIRKGRTNWNPRPKIQGENHPQSRLTEDQVRMVRSSDVSWRGAKRKLAKQLGVSDTLIRQIISRKAWKYVI